VAVIVDLDDAEAPMVGQWAPGSLPRSIEAPRRHADIWGE